eukprot:570840-Pelagomonas_calceolata.AAC.6
MDALPGEEERQTYLDTLRSCLVYKEVPSLKAHECQARVYRTKCIQDVLGAFARALLPAHRGAYPEERLLDAGIPPVVPLVARSGKNVQQLLDAVLQAHQDWDRRHPWVYAHLMARM